MTTQSSRQLWHELDEIETGIDRLARLTTRSSAPDGVAWMDPSAYARRYAEMFAVALEFHRRQMGTVAGLVLHGQTRRQGDPDCGDRPRLQPTRAAPRTYADAR
jgi:hypothetical protein